MTGAFNWFVFTLFRRSWSQLSSHRHCEPKCSVYKRKLVLPKDGAWKSCQFWVTWWSMGNLLVGPCLPSLSLWLNDYHVCIRSAWDAEDIVWFGLIWMNQLLYSLRTDDSSKKQGLSSISGQNLKAIIPWQTIAGLKHHLFPPKNIYLFIWA